MKISAMIVDADAVEAGEWFDELPEMGNLQLKVRGYSNMEYRKLQARLIEAVPRARKPGGRLNPDEQDRIMSVCLAETVLLDWRGLEDEHGNALTFSKETALKLLTEPKLRKFRETVVYASSMVGEKLGRAEPREDFVSA